MFCVALRNTMIRRKRKKKTRNGKIRPYVLVLQSNTRDTTMLLTTHKQLSVVRFIVILILMFNNNNMFTLLSSLTSTQYSTKNLKIINRKQFL